MPFQRATKADAKMAGAEKTNREGSILFPFPLLSSFFFATGDRLLR